MDDEEEEDRDEFEKFGSKGSEPLNNNSEYLNGFKHKIDDFAAYFDS